VIVVCEALAEAGHWTCADPSHRSLEHYHYEKGKAMFQLKQRLECLKVSQTHDSIASADGGEEECLEGFGTVKDEDVEVDANGICDSSV
jgi:hypothetical protein